MSKYNLEPAKPIDAKEFAEMTDRFWNQAPKYTKPLLIFPAALKAIRNYLKLNKEEHETKSKEEVTQKEVGE